MNFRYVVNQFGVLLLLLGVVELLIAAAYFGIEGALHHEVRPPARLALLLSAAAGLVVGGGTWLATRRGSRHLGRREALLLVAMSWVLGAAFAALPYALWSQLSERPEAAQFANFVDCYFESMSGLTTTGATILDDIESIPRSLLLWRAVTHWLGGLGIVVLFVAVLPSLGVGGKKLYRLEAPGPKKEGLQPQIRETARVLWFIYLGLTAILIVALRLAGMDWFDSVCHTFATLATGGFSTRNASVGAYDGVAIQIVLIVFMVLAGANFGLYYQLIRGRVRSVFKDVEFRLYLAMMFAVACLVFLSLANRQVVMTDGAVVGPDAGRAAIEAAFTAVSVQTTTGFCSSDFNLWPFLAQGLLVLSMFVGGSSGSTAGGIKVIRIWITFKVMVAEIEKVFRPNVVRPVKVGGASIDDHLKLTTVAFVIGIVVLFVIGAGLIMLLEQAHPNPEFNCSFTTAATASVATLCTIGPGLDQVGAVENYRDFWWPSKVTMCVLMALGRLEVFAIIVLFSPRFWSGR